MHYLNPVPLHEIQERWIDKFESPRAGSTWEHVRTDGSGVADVVGTVVETAPPRRLVLTFGSPDEPSSDAPSRVTFDIEPYNEIVRLTVTHDDIATPSDYELLAAGWPAVLANLKSLLETGHVLPQAPWEMDRELRAAATARHDA